ncbi:NAD(P)-dependent oxidoreductase [Streptomyces sp. B6B3]|uniref:NAD(P)-dependent oxidoreductase n=1 Tax=Streptomyces sp. B6B3 TaxID=3153570 RepID=UPI00325EEC54
MSSSDSVPAGSAGVGVVGLGAMGARLAAGIAGGDRQILVHDAAPAAVERARQQRLVPADGLSDLVARSEVVVLSLPTPAIVLDVVGQVAEAAGGRAVTVLDTSTIDPGTARRAAAVMAAAGGRYADAPILGRPGSVGSWTFPVGGEEDLVALAADVLGPVAKQIVGVGPTGAAAATKVLNNLMLGTINAVTAEVLVLAEAAGLDPGAFVDVVVDSGAASVSPLFRDVAARAVDGDFSPTFSLRLMHKDNALALTMADELLVPVNTGRAAQHLNTMALASGLGDEDSIAVLKTLEDLTGRRARRHDAG